MVFFHEKTNGILSEIVKLKRGCPFSRDFAVNNVSQISQSCLIETQE